ncbi:MAG: hypothetical protein A2521_10825 [Deltaproteobacteria bacterium RIFOXYD12_FULL_57_12]|nr:MAG: hypothetical protein A2521_10825 [Deltaproteobacteria bacterium RIFOXYD12_FULL_57_12]
MSDKGLQHIKLLGIILAILTALVAGHNQPARAGKIDAAAFYQGKVVKLVVGYAPGGGYDILARTLAPWIEQKTGATVVVENRPGGGGLAAINQVVESTADGLTIMLANGQAAALAQLLELEGVRFDLLRVPWLARVAVERNVLMVSKQSAYRSIADLQRAADPIKWAGGGKADTMADTAACVSEALGLKAKIIIGYKGSKEAALSTMRNETDGIITTDSSALGYVKGEDLLVPVAVLDRSRSPLFPDLPTVFESAELDKEHAWWIDYRAQVAQIGRVLLTTPGTPGERVEFLTAAFREILADPAFTSESGAKGHTITYASADELRGLLRTTMQALNADQLARVRSVVLEKYYR